MEARCVMEPGDDRGPGWQERLFGEISVASIIYLAGKKQYAGDVEWEQGPV